MYRSSVICARMGSQFFSCHRFCIMTYRFPIFSQKTASEKFGSSVLYSCMLRYCRAGADTVVRPPETPPPFFLLNTIIRINIITATPNMAEPNPPLPPPEPPQSLSQSPPPKSLPPQSPPPKSESPAKLPASASPDSWNISANAHRGSRIITSVCFRFMYPPVSGCAAVPAAGRSIIQVFA